MEKMKKDKQMILFELEKLRRKDARICASRLAAHLRAYLPMESGMIRTACPPPAFCFLLSALLEGSHVDCLSIPSLCCLLFSLQRICGAPR